MSHLTEEDHRRVDDAMHRLMRRKAKNFRGYIEYLYVPGLRELGVFQFATRDTLDDWLRALPSSIETVYNDDIGQVRVYQTSRAVLHWPYDMMMYPSMVSMFYCNSITDSIDPDWVGTVTKNRYSSLLSTILFKKAQ